MHFWQRAISLLLHRMGWNSGAIQAWADPSGRIMVGFMCECGDLHGVHEIPAHLLPPSPHKA